MPEKCAHCKEYVGYACNNTRDMEDSADTICKEALAKLVRLDASVHYIVDGGTAQEAAPADEWMQYGATHYRIGSTDPGNITIHDIAWALATTNRYNGHAKQPVSVAKHSIFVSRLLDLHTLEAMYGLAHDVHETVTHDMVRPIKRYLGPTLLAALKAVENAADEALFKCFGLPWPMPPEIKARVAMADNVAMATEQRDLLPKCDREWMCLAYPPHHTRLAASHYESDYQTFLRRFNELAPALGLSKVDTVKPKWHPSSTLSKRAIVEGAQQEEEDEEDFK